jgi:hypothetical protein
VIAGCDRKLEELTLIIDEKNELIDHLMMQLEKLEKEKTPDHVRLLEMTKRFKTEIEILKKDQERQLRDHKEMLDLQEAEHVKKITKLH